MARNVQYINIYKHFELIKKITRENLFKGNTTVHRIVPGLIRQAMVLSCNDIIP